jgi:hypothetical protein
MSNTAVVITAVDETRAAFASVNAGIESMGAAAGAVTSMLSGLLAGVGLAGFAHMVRGTIEATANLNDGAAGLPGGELEPRRLFCVDYRV